MLAILLGSCGKSTTRQNDALVDSSRVLRALIIDGQNNHGIWPKTSAMMKDYLGSRLDYSKSISRVLLIRGRTGKTIVCLKNFRLQAQLLPKQRSRRLIRLFRPTSQSMM